MLSGRSFNPSGNVRNFHSLLSKSCFDWLSQSTWILHLFPRYWRGECVWWPPRKTSLALQLKKPARVSLLPNTHWIIAILKTINNNRIIIWPFAFWLRSMQNSALPDDSMIIENGRADNITHDVFREIVITRPKSLEGYGVHDYMMNLNWDDEEFVRSVEERRKIGYHYMHCSAPGGKKIHTKVKPH